MTQKCTVTLKFTVDVFAGSAAGFAATTPEIGCTDSRIDRCHLGASLVDDVGVGDGQAWTR